MKKDTRHRKYLLTINNPAEEWTHERIRAELEKMNLLYWCMADEQGLQEQTPHTHIFFKAKRAAIRFSTVKGYFPAAHIDAARGTSAENREYVQKSGKWAEDGKVDTSISGTFEEWGELPMESPGQRTDWDVALSMLEDGHSAMDVIRSQTHLMRFRTALEQVRQDLVVEEYRDKWRNLETIYIWGVTGIGKTRYVMDSYGYSNVYQVNNYKHPFDGYAGENVMLFDEFNSNFRIQDMNNYLDGYPLTLPARYANKQACYERVFIISNLDLREQYHQEWLYQRSVWDAFIRRIHKVIYFLPDGTRREYETRAYLFGAAEWEDVSPSEQKIIDEIFQSDTGEKPY